jgi:hypothetical protein
MIQLSHTGIIPALIRHTVRGYGSGSLQSFHSGFAVDGNCSSSCNQVGFWQDGAPDFWPSLVTRLITPQYDEVRFFWSTRFLSSLVPGRDNAHTGSPRHSLSQRAPTPSPSIPTTMDGTSTRNAYSSSTPRVSQVQMSTMTLH